MADPGDKGGGLLSTARTRLTEIANSIQGPRPAQSLLFPAFDDLPPVAGQPQGCLWSFFDKSGIKDELGTLNLLTPEVVLAASREIRTGQHVQLDWCLSDNVEFPGFGRKKFEQRILDAKANGGRHAGFDDELSFNTQSGSQWDSFKHFAHQKSGMYYNGLSHEDAGKTDTNGIHRWCERGGIVGRGVLVDWLTWHEETTGEAAPSPVTRYEISVAELEDCLKWQGTTLRQGDIVLVRSGYTRWHHLASASERKRGTQEQALAIGLQSNEATVRWLYEHHVAAVAGDTVAFEAWPPPFKQPWVLHEWLLVQWGTPIGELWNLEELSEACRKQKRWSFFLTSAPLHVRGGVGSPPGAIAIL